MKKCCKCKKIHPLDDFAKSRRSTDGLQPRCRHCQRKMDQDRYRKNAKEIKERRKKKYLSDPESERQRSLKWYHLNHKKARDTTILRRHGIRHEQYQSMSRAQKQACAICNSIPDNQHLCIDHDHVTGSIRGLLCRKCNLLIGCAGDSIERLRVAIEYLAHWQEEEGKDDGEESLPTGN